MNIEHNYGPWTRTPPTEPGFYWFWPVGENGKPYGGATVVQVNDPPDPDGNTWLWFIAFETAAKASELQGLFHPVEPSPRIQWQPSMDGRTLITGKHVDDVMSEIRKSIQKNAIQRFRLTECPDCGGDGCDYAEADKKCKLCDGTGYVE